MTMSDQLEKSALPTSFGSFKPVGYLMIGVPSKDMVAQTCAALRAGGWAESTLTMFMPRESIDQMRAMVANASSVSGFGSEIGMMRRYLNLSCKGYHWLLVYAPDEDNARRAADLAQRQGATLAVHYRSLVVEDMIEV